MANKVNTARRRRTLGLALLLLLLAFLFGTPAYTEKKNHPPAGPAAGGATTYAQYPSSGITYGAHHSGTVRREDGTHWLPAYVGAADGEGGRLQNLTLLRDIASDEWHRHGGSGGGVPGEGAAGGGSDGGFGGGGFGGGGPAGRSLDDPDHPATDDWRFKPDPDPNGPPAFVPPLETAISAVPEPESWVLMILGLGAVGAMLRRRDRPNRFGAASALVKSPSH